MTSMASTKSCGWLPAIAVGVTSLFILSSVLTHTTSATITNKLESLDRKAVIDLLKQLVNIEENEEHSEVNAPSHKSLKGSVECGKPYFKPKPNAKQSVSRIVGGVLANEHSWPWQVSVQFRDSADFKFAHQCGGSVLADNRYVLTAAHCVIEDDGTTKLAANIQVVAGNQLWQANEAGVTQIRSVSNVIAHAGYDPTSMDNDIALLKLSQPFTFNNYVSPVCLAGSNEASTRTLCTVTGWGAQKSDGDITSVLYQVGVPIVSRSVCYFNYRGGITDNMICAGYAMGGKDSCQGDSGGPLVCKSGDAYYLNGVVSFGGGCGAPDSPGVYARVSRYIGWIRGKGVNV